MNLNMVDDSVIYIFFNDLQSYIVHSVVSWNIYLTSCLIFARMDRQRREEELKTRSSKKGPEPDLPTSNRVYGLSHDVKIV